MFIILLIFPPISISQYGIIMAKEMAQYKFLGGAENGIYCKYK